MQNGLSWFARFKLIELNDIIGPAVNSALDGQKKPDETLKEAAQRQRQILARRD